MFTQFPCNTCVFGLSCAGSYLCVFVLFCVLVFVFVFPVCLFFFFSYNVGVLSRSQSRRKCFTWIRTVPNGPRPFHPFCIYGCLVFEVAFPQDQPIVTSQTFCSLCWEKQARGPVTKRNARLWFFRAELIVLICTFSLAFIQCNE